MGSHFFNYFQLLLRLEADAKYRFGEKISDFLPPIDVIIDPVPNNPR